MATIFNLFRSIGNQLGTSELTHPAGFTPLSADQMDRMKGGFDNEGDPADEDVGDPEPDPDTDPLAGQLPEEDGIE